ncbi:MAG TPA: hemolysin family protein [Edaphocola sp.]|nr:hemolysin family protein [Edaphocola sp.]
MDTIPLQTVILSSVDAAEPLSLLKILFTLFLVLLNGFFVAAEFAIVKVRSSQIDVKADVNKQLAKTAKTIVNNLDAYLAATQLGVTLASLGLGWIGEGVMTAIIFKLFALFGASIDPGLAHSLAVPVAFILITILHIVFGELAPKSLAIRHPANTTFTVAWPLRIFYFVFRPFIWLLNSFANFILRIIGIRPVHGSEIHSEEELRVIITESHEGGAIEETERALIQNVFDFDDRRVSNIQTLRKNISAIELDKTVREAIDYAIQEGYSRYPVYDGSLDDIKGVLYTKDLIKHVLDNPDQKRIEPIMRKANFISESAKIKNVLKEFQQKHIQMAIVTNEIGELTGIVSMEDILEELVGEIQDEYDNEKPIVEKTGEYTYLVNAHHTLSDINKYLPYRLEEGEHYETLAGLISERYEDQELKEGDEIALDHYQAIVLKMYRNSAETVQLKTIMEQDSEEGS